MMMIIIILVGASSTLQFMSGITASAIFLLFRGKPIRSWILMKIELNLYFVTCGSCIIYFTRPL